MCPLFLGNVKTSGNVNACLCGFVEFSSLPLSGSKVANWSSFRLWLHHALAQAKSGPVV